MRTKKFLQYLDDTKHARFGNTTKWYRNQAVWLLGGKCSHCGFKERHALQVDHINGDGRKDRRRYNSPKRYWQAVLKSVKNQEGRYQVLCANCNWIKALENKEFSHPLTNSPK